MTPHVHDQDISTWSAARLRQHIQVMHGYVPPMSWGSGELHQSHLALHLDTRTPEKKPMSHCGHQCPDALIACTYEIGHAKLTDPADQFGGVIHGTFDHGNVRADAWWVEVPETKEHTHADLGHFHHITSRYDVASHLMNAHGVAREDIAVTEVISQHASLHPAPDPHVNRPALTDRLEEALSGQRLLQAANVRQVAAMTELEERLREVIAEREEAQEDFRRVCREKQDAQDALHLLQGQWDRVVPRLEDRLIKRTEALATGQAALGEFISELKRDSQPDPSYYEIQSSQVIQRLEQILGGQRPQASTCDEPHLGLATTGELIEEIRTRIDLGHCGLGYRTVDTEGDD